MRRDTKIVGMMFLGLILLCWSSSAFGEDWALYYESGAEMQYYDRSTLERPQKDLVYVSVKTTELSRQKGEIMRFELSCAVQKYRVLTANADKVTGVPVPEGGPQGYPWKSFSQESIMGALWDNVCQGRGRGPGGRLR
jgi:hypothetical protein